MLRPLIRLLSSLQVTDAIPRPVTRSVNGALAHPARTPVSLALAGADRYADTWPLSVPRTVHISLDEHETAESAAPPGSL